ncbi:dual specificity protein kinase YAK1 homolog isoform X1 [Zingiber officinale]|uniref:dual specificity protein kinase YAK1 homolog isoform X1 n=1 Tax=Zingiber officinale TaxID=94328 RepID=UPI001C4BD871|nr:dual specificity protein kinase YAK1 homolog isoform X1 [Zingiber officinale]
MAEDGSGKVGADGSCDTSIDAYLRWNPRSTAFRPYVSPPQSSGENSLESSGRDTSKFRGFFKKSLVAKLTKGIVETFQTCNPAFRYSESLNQKRFLTNPSTGVLNDGFDNANSDLILYVNFELVNSETKGRYIVKDALGQGTFGQVAKCWDLESNKYVAVKVIKNQPAYYRQALVEVSILDMLNKKYDPDDKHHIVRMLDYFVFHRHLCISFEMLGSNLYELIKMNHFKGLSLSIVQAFSKQILHALIVMKDAGIIHCDMKPENILMSTSVKPPQIKVIDFGSACMEGRTVYSYIQSRYYRSPEVLLGYPYTTSIDMWSFGCIVAELFLGLPLFPGASEYDLLKRMIEILGGQPPDSLLRDAKNTSKFFKHVGSIHSSEHDGTSKGGISAYRILTVEEYESRESNKPDIGKHYFNFVNLDDIIDNYPYRRNLSDKEKLKESLTRLALVDFLRGLVEFDPVKRWSPLQASGHPFVTGEPFDCPYKPPLESPRIPVMHTVTVDHNPGGGHWLAAGLSPQVVSSVNKYSSQSPHVHKVPMSYGSSYGSFGSHGSYNDNTGLGSSYGSYGDVNNIHAYNSPLAPSGFNVHVQVGGPFLGASPDARHRSQFSHGHGYSVSPYGGLGPMSLGVSPSQFTPPSSQMQISSASPGKYGPTSPVGGGSRGISLSKAAVVGQYNKRGVGYSSMSVQPYGSASEHGQGFSSDGMTSNHPETQSLGHGGPYAAFLASSHTNWRQQLGGASGFCSSTSVNLKGYPAPYMHNSMTSQRSEVPFDITEGSSSVPHPGEWDPGYSDESLLQEDNGDISSLSTEFVNCVHLDDPSDVTSFSSGNNRYSHGQNQARLNSKFLSSNQRTDGLRQTYSHVEGPSTSHDVRGGNGRPLQFSQNFPSRFGQQSTHRYNYMNQSIMHGERNHQYGQPAYLNYNITDSHSSTNAMFSNSMPWGRRGGHPMTTTLPAAHSRKDYGKI